mmetsp:Transcript_44924/g.137190  ORF Transcript_44924/g.137190 Transcript_44924/m.137190 type:complete len:504 (-) Transcript_44924:187-1698(-)
METIREGGRGRTQAPEGQGMEEPDVAGEMEGWSPRGYDISSGGAPRVVSAAATAAAQGDVDRPPSLQLHEPDVSGGSRDLHPSPCVEPDGRIEPIVAVHALGRVRHRNGVLEGRSRLGHHLGRRVARVRQARVTTGHHVPQRRAPIQRPEGTVQSAPQRSAGGTIRHPHPEGPMTLPARARALVIVRPGIGVHPQSRPGAVEQRGMIQNHGAVRAGTGEGRVEGTVVRHSELDRAGLIDAVRRRRDVARSRQVEEGRGRLESHRGHVEGRSSEGTSSSSSSSACRSRGHRAAAGGRRQVLCAEPSPDVQAVPVLLLEDDVQLPPLRLLPRLISLLPPASQTSAPRGRGGGGGPSDHHPGALVASRPLQVVRESRHGLGDHSEFGGLLERHAGFDQSILNEFLGRAEEGLRLRRRSRSRSSPLPFSPAGLGLVGLRGAGRERQTDGITLDVPRQFLLHLGLQPLLTAENLAPLRFGHPLPLLLRLLPPPPLPLLLLLLPPLLLL